MCVLGDSWGLLSDLSLSNMRIYCQQNYDRGLTTAFRHRWWRCRQPARTRRAHLRAAGQRDGNEEEDWGKAGAGTGARGYAGTAWGAFFCAASPVLPAHPLGMDGTLRPRAAVLCVARVHSRTAGHGTGTTRHLSAHRKGWLTARGWNTAGLFK